MNSDTKTPSKSRNKDLDDCLPDTPFQKYEDLNSSLNSSMNSDAGEIEVDMDTVALYKGEVSKTDRFLNTIPALQVVILLLIVIVASIFFKTPIVNFIEAQM